MLCAASASLGLGCQSTSRAIDDRAADEMAEVHRDAQLAIVQSSCPGGRPIGPSCGLYMRYLTTPDFRERFRASRCEARTEEECQTLYERMLTAQLKERYFAADVEAVTQRCDLDPGKCDDPVAYEMLLLDSHNDEIGRRGVRAQIEVEENRRAAHARNDAENAELVGVVAAAAIASTYNGPRCLSYPSILTGALMTRCSSH
jgi:hypothetical protein